MKDPRASMLRWIKKQRRSRSECERRWGHYFEDAEREGVVKTTDRRAILRDGVRDITDTVIVVEPGEKP